MAKETMRCERDATSAQTMSENEEKCQEQKCVHWCEKKCGCCKCVAFSQMDERTVWCVYILLERLSIVSAHKSITWKIVPHFLVKISCKWTCVEEIIEFVKRWLHSIQPATISPTAQLYSGLINCNLLSRQNLKLGISGKRQSIVKKENIYHRYLGANSLWILLNKITFFFRRKSNRFWFDKNYCYRVFACKLPSIDKFVCSIHMINHRFLADSIAF